jgi:hypothetical protein
MEAAGNFSFRNAIPMQMGIQTKPADGSITSALATFIGAY